MSRLQFRVTVDVLVHSWLESQEHAAIEQWIDDCLTSFPFAKKPPSLPLPRPQHRKVKRFYFSPHIIEELIAWARRHHMTAASIVRWVVTESYERDPPNRGATTT